MRALRSYGAVRVMQVTSLSHTPPFGENNFHQKTSAAHSHRIIHYGISLGDSPDLAVVVGEVSLLKAYMSIFSKLPSLEAADEAAAFDGAVALVFVVVLRSLFSEAPFNLKKVYPVHRDRIGSSFAFVHWS